VKTDISCPWPLLLAPSDIILFYIPHGVNSLPIQNPQQS
jgi:hypothetical protein